MKQFIIASFMIASALFITACGNNDNYTPTVNATQTQEETAVSPPATTTPETAQVEPSEATTSTAPPATQGDYYTFGDVIRVGGSGFEVTFFDNIIFDAPLAPLPENAVDALVELYNKGLILVPARLTNTLDQDRNQGFVPGRHTVVAPSGDESQILFGGWQLLADPDPFPNVFRSIGALESQYGYMKLEYGGSGIYEINFRQDNTSFRLPIYR